MFSSSNHFRRSLARMKAELRNSQDEQFLIVPEPLVSWQEYVDVFCSLRIAQGNIEMLVASTNLVAAELSQACQDATTAEEETDG